MIINTVQCEMRQGMWILTVVTAVELCTERNPITPTGGIDADPLRNNWHLEDVVSNIVAVRVSLEQL